MAQTVAINSNWTALTGKTLSRQSVLTSKIKEAVFDVCVSCCCTYCTGGITVDLSAGSRITTIISAEVTELSNSLVAQYNPAACSPAATGTVVFSDEAAGCCATALAEIACGSCLIQCSTFKVHVIGF